VVGAKEPAGHGWKPPSTFPKKPGAATQSASTTELWEIVVAPAGQASQAASLVEALKEPTAHGAHVDPPYPGRHTQFSDCTVPVSSVVLFAPQAQQPWASAQPLPAVEALPTASLKVPCGHAAHAPLSSRKPALQRQELAAVPVAGCEFAGQAMQVASLVCPVNAEYVPAPQSMQMLAPVAEYLPAAQLLQVLDVVAAKIVEYLPASQSVQASKDTVSLYLPAAHEEQLFLFGPVWPAGHPVGIVACDIQSSGSSLPAGETESAGQAVHVEADMAAIAVEYVLLGQLVHGALPVATLYLPAVHSAQL
jgi:hypothetical protein